MHYGNLTKQYKNCLYQYLKIAADVYFISKLLKAVSIGYFRSSLIKIKDLDKQNLSKRKVIKVENGQGNNTVQHLKQGGANSLL